MADEITREALLAAGWKHNVGNYEYIYGETIRELPCVVPSPVLAGHLFCVQFDRESPDVVRRIFVMEDDLEFNDVTTHATGIENMQDLMTWVRLTGEKA